jgi:hypothetical protein
MLCLFVAAAIVFAAAEPRDLHPSLAELEMRVARDPLDLPALRDLGLRLDGLGRRTQAEALLSFVGDRSWRDGPAEVWLLRRRLVEGRFREAFESADSLLRRDADGSLRPALFPMLVAPPWKPAWPPRRGGARISCRLWP